MLEAIKERHPLIAQFLASGEGIKLQREDSDIAIDIINQHVKMNVPILTVHDSFIVPKIMEPFTLDIMNQAYGKLVSRYFGSGYESVIDTIHYDKGILEGNDTTNNINVDKLIKPAFKVNELSDAYNRINTRVITKQLIRQFKWCNNQYQYSKLYRLL